MERDQGLTSYDLGMASNYSKLFTESSPFQYIATAMGEYISSQVDSSSHSVLDVACGVGDYISRLHKRGFKHLDGIDISENQITLARIQIPSARLFTLDVRNLSSWSKDMSDFRMYDVVNASWLYDNATSAEDLCVMMSSIRSVLRYQGIHTGMVINPNARAASAYELETWGVALMTDKPQGYLPADGERIIGDIKQSKEDSIRFAGYFYTEETLRSCFERSGFGDVCFVYPKSWDHRLLGLDVDNVKRFVSYAHDNPEMCAFFCRAY
jgi:SAM-dependent methyltransferase